MRKFIGWLANFYPNHIFFANSFMANLKVSAVSDGENYILPHELETAKIVLCIGAARSLEKGEKMSTEFTAIMYDEREIGDFVLSISRV
jgi:hypothetical protein